MKCPKHPAATNPTMRTGCHAGSKLRRIVGLNRSAPAEAARGYAPKMTSCFFSFRSASNSSEANQKGENNELKPQPKAGLVPRSPSAITSSSFQDFIQAFRLLAPFPQSARLKTFDQIL